MRETSGDDLVAASAVIESHVVSLCVRMISGDYLTVTGITSEPCGTSSFGTIPGKLPGCLLVLLPRCAECTCYVTGILCVSCILSLRSNF